MRTETGYWRPQHLPSPEELTAYYRDHYYQADEGNYCQTYTSDEIEFFRNGAAQLFQYVQLAGGPASGGAFLDVGCGEGFLLNHAASQGWDVTGLDMSEVGVMTHHPQLRKHLRTGDVFELLQSISEAGDRFDLISLCHVLEHVVDPAGLLQSLAGVVHPEGVIVASVPNDFSHLQQEYLQRGIVQHEYWVALPDHLAYFDAVSLRATCEAAGYRVLSLFSSFPIDWFLAHPGSNYIVDPAQGKPAHRARMLLQSAIDAHGVAKAYDYYCALAALGMGRDLTIVLRPQA